MIHSWVSSSLFSLLSTALGLVTIYKLVKPIMSPSIRTFPWKDDEKEDRIVILAASYNPSHLGHMGMLEYLSKRYRKVIAVVGFNPNKKYLVTPEERASLLGQMLKNTSLTNVQVEVVEGYVWRYAKREGATVFFRGIRSWEKDGSDERSLQILNTWGPMLLGPLVWPIPTIYLEGNPKYNHVSSTLIRDLCKSDGNNNAKDSLAELVPPNVANLVSSLYSAKDQ